MFAREMQTWMYALLQSLSQGVIPVEVTILDVYTDDYYTSAIQYKGYLRLTPTLHLALYSIASLPPLYTKCSLSTCLIVYESCLRGCCRFVYLQNTEAERQSLNHCMPTVTFYNIGYLLALSGMRGPNEMPSSHM